MAYRKKLFGEFDLEVHWLPLGELTSDAELSCIDGRHRGYVLGAPGGDTGELVLMLGALESLSDYVFPAEEIEHILESYMERHGRFYKHTDRDALIALETSIAGDDELSAALEDAGSIDALLLGAPPIEVRAKLADLLVEPRHVGCGHLRTMLEFIEEYGVRRELVEDTIRAFFQLLWKDNPQADFTILEGQHEESVIITFDTEQELSADTLMPSICASEEGPYLFANHEAARRYKRRIDLDVLSDAADLHFFGQTNRPDETEEQARQRLLGEAQQLAQRQAAATISHLAPDLPSYSVTYRGRELNVDVVD